MLYPALLLLVCCQCLIVPVPAKDACAAGDGDCAVPASDSDDSGADDTLLLQMRSDRPLPPGVSTGSPGASLVAADYHYPGYHEKPPLKEVPITPYACTAIEKVLGTSMASGPWHYMCSKDDMRNRMSQLTNGCLYVQSDNALKALFNKVDRPWPWCFINIYEGSFFPTTGACPSLRPGVEATSLGGHSVTACSGGLLSKDGACMPATELGHLVARPSWATLNLTVFKLDGWVTAPEQWRSMMQGTKKPRGGAPKRFKVTRTSKNLPAPPLGAIPVHYYICGGKRSPIFGMGISQQVLESQTEVMNKGFAGTDTCTDTSAYSYTPQFYNTRIAFATASINDLIYQGCDDDCDQAATALLQGPLRQEQSMTKILVCDGMSFLGFVTGFPGDSDNRLTVILAGSVPGGNSPPYNEGKTLTHEMGHYLGLWHTFQSQNGTCVNGDEVADTNNEASPAFGCPSMRRTCDNSLDPVHNFMDYVDDDCMCSFTMGQNTRMREELYAYQMDLWMLAFINMILSLLCCM